ncbi:MAG: cyclomaltodextrinase C-terminal domain-containing protein [Ignavibacteriales bacterium]|nr:cyclomaltodextrinase C-terminal domain-containing protein [Ignavibacteriales bacterium]
MYVYLRETKDESIIVIVNDNDKVFEADLSKYPENFHQNSKSKKHQNR